MTDAAPTGFALADLRIQLLSTIAGSADVTAFLCFHDVFTSAMTGNLALFGVAIGQGKWFLATHSLLALLGFMLGASLAGGLGRRRALGGDGMLLLEGLGLLGFAAAWWIWGIPHGGWRLDSMILASAFAMGVQGVLARQINVASVPSVVFTNTLTSILLSTVKAWQERKPLSWATRQQLAALGAYALGAVVFAALLRWSPMLAFNLPLLLLLIVWYVPRHGRPS